MTPTQIFNETRKNMQEQLKGEIPTNGTVLLHAFETRDLLALKHTMGKVHVDSITYHWKTPDGKKHQLDLDRELVCKELRRRVDAAK